jgi:hypothetical protein
MQVIESNVKVRRVVDHDTRHFLRVPAIAAIV